MQLHADHMGVEDRMGTAPFPRRESDQARGEDGSRAAAGAEAKGAEQAREPQSKTWGQCFSSDIARFSEHK